MRYKKVNFIKGLIYKKCLFDTDTHMTVTDVNVLRLRSEVFLELDHLFVLCYLRNCYFLGAHTFAWPPFICSVYYRCKVKKKKKKKKVCYRFLS